MSVQTSETEENFKPLEIVICKCGLSSLSWNMTCARCGTDLFPEKDDVDRHKQRNSA